VLMAWNVFMTARAGRVPEAQAIAPPSAVAGSVSI
jgi:hypothetical protein